MRVYEYAHGLAAIHGEGPVAARVIQSYPAGRVKGDGLRRQGRGDVARQTVARVLATGVFACAPVAKLYRRRGRVVLLQRCLLRYGGVRSPAFANVTFTRTEPSSIL
jgi:hypothetical protein